MSAATDINQSKQEATVTAVEDKNAAAAKPEPVEPKTVKAEVAKAEPVSKGAEPKVEKPVAPTSTSTASTPTPNAANSMQSSAAEQPVESGFWRGIVLGVASTVALAAFPVYHGVTNHQSDRVLLEVAQSQTLGLKITMAQKDLSIIEGKLAEIAALEAEYKAMLNQKDVLEEQRLRLAESIEILKAQ